MTTAPAPFTTPAIDVRDLDGFMLNSERLLASELWALSTGEEFKAAMGLWCRAWKQMPAASLPNDERVLASFAGVTAKRWATIRAVALRGFILCNDGRLYHQVLAQDAIRAYAKKQERRERTAAATEARKANRNGHRDDQRNVDVTRSQGQGQGQGQGQIDIPTPSSSSVVPPREDYPATTATTLPASPSLDIPTAAHRFRAANAVKIAKAAKARDLPGLLAAFGANAKYPEWAAVTDGLNVATIVAVLGLAVAHGGVIRAPSGFIKGKRAWDAMSKDERAEAGRAQCLLYGIEIPPTNKETT